MPMRNDPGSFIRRFSTNCSASAKLLPRGRRSSASRISSSVSMLRSSNFVSPCLTGPPSARRKERSSSISSLIMTATSPSLPTSRKGASMSYRLRSASLFRRDPSLPLTGAIPISPLCPLDQGRGLFCDPAERECRLYCRGREGGSSEPEHPERPDHHVQQLSFEEEVSSSLEE